MALLETARKPDGTPVVPATDWQGYLQAVPVLDPFVRLRLGFIAADEEARFDSPGSYPNSFAYVGVAPAGSSVSAAVWNVMRVSYDSNGRKSREQFRAGISWESRPVGW